MTSTTSSEGIAPYSIPNSGKECGTWYKVFGKLSNQIIPLVALHGGPGAGHEYLLPLEDLTRQHNIPVVLFDQVGCGRSTALPEKDGDESFWTVELFEKEIENLVNYLGITRFDIFGHSWGGMYASVYATKRPQGLRKLILMGTAASQELVIKGTSDLMTQLPQDVQEIMQRHEANGDYGAPAYKGACLEFYKQHLCRCNPWPAELEESMSHLESDPTVYGTMWGPSELLCTGTLKGWSVIPEAHKIENTTLIINGEFDEVIEEASTPLFERIPKAKWIIIPKSSHTAMWENREHFMRVVAAFLTAES